jgi:hypothetical protein
MRQAVQPLATQADTQPLEGYLVILRALTSGARWKRRFSFLIVDVPASYQRNLLRDYQTELPSVDYWCLWRLFCVIYPLVLHL